VTERRPLIAVPAMWSAKIQGLRYSGTAVANAGLTSIVRAGGEPLGLTPATEFGAWDVIDGIVVPGGADIDPARYGAVADEHDWRTDFDGQDDADARALKAAEEHGIPALLICRGMQLWNVERGGTMVQHLPEEPQQHVGTIHDVDITVGSVLASALGGRSTVDVSSYHHQGVGELGEGLVVVSRAADGTIEAIEDPAHEIVAVQWHPEDRAADGPAGTGDGEVNTDQQLFDWVVERARRRADTR